MLVTLLSLFSFSGTHVLPVIRIPHFDKLVHLAFYLGATILGTLCIWERTNGRYTLHKTIGWAVGYAIFYGIIIEVLQAWFTTYRQGDILDVLANTAGALLGGLVVKLIFSGNTSLKWKK